MYKNKKKSVEKQKRKMNKILYNIDISQGKKICF